MEDTFANAFLLLMVGMLTVFSILFLVMLSGNILIRISNQFAPVAVEKINLSNKTSAPSLASADESKNMAVIGAIIAKLTNGKGRVTKIEKQD